MYLAELPPEIYSGILAHVSRNERQQTTLSLTRAIPRSPVPLHHLFECISLKSAKSVVQLYLRLRGCREEPRWIQEFSLETWSVDADVVVSLLALLSRLSRISLFVGPDFAPEHLEEILEKPKETLQYISFRFRPYVQRATYYQFLKVRKISPSTLSVVNSSGNWGAYFDSALEALSRWPTTNLPTLSIVQDPLDSEIARTHHFAQPLVFFRLDPLRTLACSSYLRTLTSLRLRVPSRPVAPFIYGSPLSIPELRILDLSTCNIRLTEMEALVGRFRQLKHLIVDECDIASGDTQENEWVNIGKACALATVKAAREREKKLKTWLEAHAVRMSPDAGVTIAPGEQAPAPRRARAGRRGLATATISFRDPPAITTMPAVRVPNALVSKVRVVPLAPTLCSLSTTTSILHKDKHDAIRARFERGWDEGIGQLAAIRNRLYQSWRNGVRMVHMVGDQCTEEGFEGLKNVEGEDAFYGRDGSLNVWSVPVLCLAGDANSDQHVDGCGHTVASSVWPDGI